MLHRRTCYPSCTDKAEAVTVARLLAAYRAGRALRVPSKVAAEQDWGKGTQASNSLGFTAGGG